MRDRDMIDETRLFPLETPLRLGVREAYVLEQIRRLGDLRDVTVGALLHARGRKHSAEEICSFCAFDGRAALRKLRKKGLVRYSRKRGVWQLATRHRSLVEYGPEVEPAGLAADLKGPERSEGPYVARSTLRLDDTSEQRHLDTLHTLPANRLFSSLEAEGLAPDGGPRLAGSER